MEPYRCITSDIFTQNSIVMKEGNLSDAVKDTMTIPLFYSPVKEEGK
jgi:NTE family protein